MAKRAFMIWATIAFLLMSGTLSGQGQNKAWRTATESELHTIIPARAPAISERIETEFRTASGITDGRGHYIAGVVMITAGYAAEGKYSHFFITQVPIKVGTISLAAGNYLFGWTRAPDGASLKVTFYQATTGAPVGNVDAPRDPAAHVESFHIWTPGEKSVIQIGRFTFPYSLGS
jgi:hypothetical protein